MCMCVCVRYSQCPQLGHVVEAGQRYEGDVIVVEGAGLETQRGEVKSRRKQLHEKSDRLRSLWFCHFYFLQTANGPNDISTNAQDRVPAIVSVRW